MTPRDPAPGACPCGPSDRCGAACCREEREDAQSRRCPRGGRHRMAAPREPGGPARRRGAAAPGLRRGAARGCLRQATTARRSSDLTGHASWITPCSDATFADTNGGEGRGDLIDYAVSLSRRLYTQGMRSDRALRAELVKFLRTEGAHTSLADAVKKFPVKDINRRPPHVPYTFWHLLEHIRIAQWDILDFIRNPNYEELRFPQDYWPARNAKATKKDWDQTIACYHSDLEEMIALVKHPKTDLHARIPHGDGQTVLREAMLIVDHTAYHVGELGILRQVVNNWT